MFFNAWYDTPKRQLICCFFLSFFPLRVGQKFDDRYTFQVEWDSDPEYDDIVIHVNETVPVKPESKVVLPQGPQLTSVMCAEECVKEPWCSSFFVDLTGKRCLLHEIVFISRAVGKRMERIPGTRYFRRYDRFCPTEERFYRWRNKGLCFRFFSKVSLTRPNHVNAANNLCKRNKGRLLLSSSSETTAWIHKVLLQSPLQYYFPCPSLIGYKMPGLPDQVQSSPNSMLCSVLCELL